MNIYEKLMNIQSELSVPKDLYNNFGKYAYRNTETILEGLKPLLIKYKTIVNVSDEIVLIGDRYYVKATATIKDIEKLEDITSTAYAREDESKKGMDLSQLTGSTSSYARKYALNGLFAIDDTKDADTTNKHGKEETKKEYKPNVPVSNGPSISEAQIKRLYAISYSAGLDANTIKEQVKTKFKKEVANLTRSEYDKVVAGYEKLKESKGD